MCVYWVLMLNGGLENKCLQGWGKNDGCFVDGWIDNFINPQREIRLSKLYLSSVLCHSKKQETESQIMFFFFFLCSNLGQTKC